jgi:hypothetical protein
MDVPLYAGGAAAAAARVHGSLENTAIFGIMKTATGW